MASLRPWLSCISELRPKSSVFIDCDVIGLDTLLGTEKGVARLAEFIEVSNAFAKETVV